MENGTDLNNVGDSKTRSSKPTLGKREFSSMWLIGIPIFVWIIFLISMIVLKGTDIGTPASADSALIAANERLLQMAQWTIATVLTLGGALIGLNWYQSEKRYDHDRQVFEDRITSEVDSKLQAHKEQLDMLSQASVMTLDDMAARMVKETVGPRDGSVTDLTFTERVINYFSTNLQTLLRRGVGRILIEEILAAGNATTGKSVGLSADQISRIKSIADDLDRDAPDLAQSVRNIVVAYEQWSGRGPGNPN